MKNLLKFIFIIVFISLIVFAGLLIFKKDSTFKNNESDYLLASSNSNEPESTKLEKTTFTLTAIGDVLCHNTQYWDAYNKSTDEYDFSYVFDQVKKYTSAGDITIANIETSFAGKDVGYSNYPTFNSPDSLVTSLKDIGIDIITTAGNHALDKGFKGLCRTIDVLDTNGIDHLGTYKTAEDQKELLIENIKGLNVAFLNYTYGTNGIPVPEGKDFCINLIDKDLIMEQINLAKEKNADVIIACMHWGTEYRTTANYEQEELADFLFENGVDIIIGNHPHVLEQMEKRTVTLPDGTTKECFVIYALGNFTADQRDTITKDSIILNLTVTRNTDGKLSIDKAEYTPIYMYKDTSVSLKKFRVIDIEQTLADYESGKDTSIGSSNFQLLKAQLTKIKSIVGDEIN